MSEGFITFEGVSYRYPRTKKNVLKNITFSVEKGDFVVILGENGAGKTTLCKCVNGIISHSEMGRLKGTVTVAGLNTKTVYTSEIAQKVGIVLEDPETQLFTTKVLSEVAFGPENLNKPPEEILEVVKWALKVVRLDGYENKPPTALSGGQKQRLAIAAALAMKPDIMVLDEPTSQIDPLGTEEVFEVIRELKEEYKMTIIMASHKVDEVLKFADKICILHQGVLVAYDKPGVIFNDRSIFQEVPVSMPTTYGLAHYLEDKGSLRMEDSSTIEEGVEAVKQIINGVKQ